MHFSYEKWHTLLPEQSKEIADKTFRTIIVITEKLLLNAIIGWHGGATFSKRIPQDILNNPLILILNRTILIHLQVSLLLELLPILQMIRKHLEKDFFQEKDF